MTKPTIIEVVHTIAEHYGLTHGQALEIMRTPTHPSELKDDFAKAAMVGVMAWGYHDPNDIARLSYDVAKAMLKVRK